MDIAQLITLFIGGSGIIGAGVTIYQVRKNAHSAAASTEVEAAAQESADRDALFRRVQGHMDFLERQVQNLRGEVQSLRDDRTYDREHIRILQRQIWAGVPPPPMKPGDPFPDDQVGG